MRVLVTWGTKLGGTAGIAELIGDALAGAGFEVVRMPASHVRELAGYDAAIVGGALYANRWHRDARRFVTRHAAALRRIPVWLFSSGPLDDSAARAPTPPPRQVAVLAERIGAIDHVTFGGRLASDAKGFPARAMAKEHSGDWRDPARIRAWSTEVARALPTARPKPAIDPPARAAWRVVAHAIVGWAVCGALIMGLMQLTSSRIALAVHAVAVPLVFAALSVHYFRRRGAREPLATAFAITAIVIGLDALVVAGLIYRSAAMFASIAGTWLPFALIFATTWATGFIVSTMPWPKPARARGFPDRVASRSGDNNSIEARP